MTDPLDSKYNLIAGNYELIGALAGLVAGAYFGSEIVSYISSQPVCSGLVSILNKDPALTRIGIAVLAGGAGFIGGKVLGSIAAYARKSKDLRQRNMERDARTEWIEQIQKRTAREKKD